MIVTMTAYNRPEFLEPVLESLSDAIFNCDEKVSVFATVDPSPVQDKVTSLFAKLEGAEMVEVLVNEDRLKLQANTYKSINLGWDCVLDEDYMLGLPDDILLAPDALRLACHLRDRWRDDKSVIFTSLFSAAGPGRFEKGGMAEPPEGYLRTNLSYHFHCQAWGTWYPTWRFLWQPLWDFSNPISWDQNVNDRVMKGKLQALPWLSRVAHIGSHGTHATPETFEADKPTRFAGDVEMPSGAYWF